jgi:uncharacterized protein (TIGR02246 family)
MTYYADDALYMAPNMEPLEGKEAIEMWMHEISESGVKVTRAEFATIDFGVGGTIAYQVGTYDMTVEIPGMDEMTNTGTYVSIWNQQEDGSWRIHAETWNSNKPAPGTQN